MISRRKKIFSFGITAVLLVGLFLFSVNTGSLKVTPLELFKGLFVAYNENVATIFDLRFPRIFIAMFGGHCGFWCVIPGGIEKSTGRSGNYRYQLRSQPCSGADYRIFPGVILLYAPVCVFGRYDRIFTGVFSLLEGWAIPPAHHSGGCSGQCHVYRTDERV